MPVEFSKAELLRYSKQLILPEIGKNGQEKLRQASVLIIGAGGLGSPVALYLASAGVGRIGLADYDRVDLSNLNRQILHSSADVGRYKVNSAAEKLLALNPEIQIDTYIEGITIENAMTISQPYEILVDCSDNYATRYLVNDLAVFTHKPVVAGAVFQFEGQVGILDARKGPCFRCLFPEPPGDEIAPSCSAIGVLGVLPGIIGLIQANETVKLILEIGSPLIGKMQIFDALQATFQTVEVPKDPKCPICGKAPTIHTLEPFTDPCRVETNTGSTLSPQKLREILTSKNEFRLIDIRDEIEREFAGIDGAEQLSMQAIIENPTLINPNQWTVFFCRTGNRSSWLVRMLANRGFERISHLEGGINAWVEQIDPEQGKY